MPNPNEDKFIDIMNLCILYAKWYIHGCKMNKEQLFLPNFIKLLRDKLTAERLLCKLNNDNSFEKRWQVLYDQL